MKYNIEEIQKIFVNHKLIIEVDLPEVKIYLFKNPENSNLWQRWILNNNVLFITGDAYEAIYKSHAFNSLQSIAECSIGYFNDKCLADYRGRYQSEFDNNKVLESIVSNVLAYNEEIEIDESKDLEFQIKEINEYFSKKEEKYFVDIPTYFSNEHEVYNFMNDYGRDFCGDDWWDGFQSTSLTINPYWHLAAIKEAVKQL